MRTRATSRSPEDRKRGDSRKKRETHAGEPHTAICAGLIIVVGMVAYANSFFGVFLYDDYPHIIADERIRELSPLTHLTTRRPLVSLSLAINYRLGELKTGGYHAVNLIVHLLAALALFGVVRRTLKLPRFSDACGEAAGWLALVIALLWTVHPLQTASVTYMIQRAESMMGLFYLLTVYCVIRSADSKRSASWAVAEFRQCLRLDPGFIEAQYHLGVVLERLGRLGEAATAFQRALAINPAFAPARQALENLAGRRRMLRPRRDAPNR